MTTLESTNLAQSIITWGGSPLNPHQESSFTIIFTPEVALLPAVLSLGKPASVWDGKGAVPKKVDTAVVVEKTVDSKTFGC